MTSLSTLFGKQVYLFSPLVVFYVKNEWSDPQEVVQVVSKLGRGLRGHCNVESFNRWKRKDRQRILEYPYWYLNWCIFNAIFLSKKKKMNKLRYIS